MDTDRKHLVILGTGFGGISLVKAIDLKLFNVTIVSPRNYFLFTPLLASTTVGTIEFRSIIEPIRTSRKNLSFYQAFCEGIDTSKKQVNCRNADDNSTFSLNYDELVIAVGAQNNTYGIPGVEKHCLFLKDVPDARRIRQRIGECFERANTPGLDEAQRAALLHFVVIGGGPTGVEFSGELFDFIKNDLSRYYPKLSKYPRISVLEAGSRLLNSFDASLSKYTARTFEKQNIDVLTDSLVVEVKEREIILDDGTKLPFGAALWSTGIAPTSLVSSLEFDKNKAGQLITDEQLQVHGTQNIYAVGDCAAIDGKAFATTAQLAMQQGKYLARALKRKSKQKIIKPFRYLDFGMLAYIGGNRALADLPSVKGRGFIAWLFWRSVYITKLVSLKNKLLVLFDWFKTTFFGRDISRF